ncbi:DNA repair protein RecO [Candidatus Berkelbacteria bacterium]|nr:DNA repair protein RecO [Candidatus Berkelbacteria bacterium]
MQKTLAIILKKQNLGETDRIITIFSPVFGKKRVVARAVRKPLSKLAGHLDTMMVSQLILTRQDDLPKITSAELVESFDNIRSSFTLLEKSFAITKIIERVILEDISQQTIFQFTLDALTRLDEQYAWNNVWLTFLSNLTDELGISITDFTCLNCAKKIQEDAAIILSDRRFICNSCLHERLQYKKISKNLIKVIQVLNKNKFDYVLRLQIPDIVAKEVEEVYLREITQWFNKPWQHYSAI